jgi:type 1 glutamine amidotransferase
MKFKMKMPSLTCAPFTILGLAVLFFVAAGSRSALAVEPIRALLITGGCCHDYGEQQTILTEGISARANVVWTILYEGGSSKGGVIRDHRMSIYEKTDWAKGYDIVVHNECFGDVTNADFVNHISKAHFDGVPAVVIHCTIHTYRKSSTDEWRKCLGVSSYSHEPGRKFNVINVNPDHPVMKGFPAVWADPAPDELYRIVKLWPNCIPLAKGIGATNSENCCVWVNTYGKARVFGTTLGHGDVTMSSDTYLDLLTRGFLWACDKLDQDGKPKPGYGKVVSK